MSRERLSIQELQALVDLLSRPSQELKVLRAASAIGTLPIVVELELDPIGEYTYRLSLREGSSILIETNDPSWKDRLIHCVFRVAEKLYSAFFLTDASMTNAGYCQAFGKLPPDIFESLLAMPQEALADSIYMVPVLFESDPDELRNRLKDSVARPPAETLREWFCRNSHRFATREMESLIGQIE